MLNKRTPLSLRFRVSQSVAQIPFRLLKRIFDHSKVCSTANSKLALWAQTLSLRPFRFTKNGYQKFFNIRSREPGQQQVPKLALLQQITLMDNGVVQKLRKLVYLCQEFS